MKKGAQYVLLGHYVKMAFYLTKQVRVNLQKFKNLNKKLIIIFQDIGEMI